MKLGEEALKILSKIYEPSVMVSKRLRRNDLAFQTDNLGRPVLLFLGKADKNGKIKGERFSRHIVTDADGKVIKDHWDNKGKIE